KSLSRRRSVWNRARRKTRAWTCSAPSQRHWASRRASCWTSEAPMTRFTRRPLNRCRHCLETWYPRGSNLSPRCPRCGSFAVEVPPGCSSIGCSPQALTVFVVGFAILFACSLCYYPIHLLRNPEGKKRDIRREKERTTQPLQWEAP